MIAFLSPVWLLAALAAAVPLVIHLMRRQTGARLEFPAVRWLERAEREHSRSLKLRNLLLMLLRVAAVLLLALAAARPVARIAGAGLLHAPTAIAIVLDNSLSTTAVLNGRPVLDDLRARAMAVASRASGDDKVWLVTADGAVTGGTPAAVRSRIAQAAPLAGAGRLEDAARQAAAIVLASPLPDRELVFVTDAQATAWSAPLALGDVRVSIYRPAGGPPADHAVVMAAAEPMRWSPRGAVHARVRAADSVTYRIELGSQTLARGIAGPDGEIFVRAAPAERGWIAGRVELEPDELRGDDARHFAAWIGAPPLVRVDPSAGVFARTAVEALEQAGRVSAGSTITVASADAAPSLPALLTAPADPVRIGAANRALERLGVPWRFGAAQRGAVSASVPAGVTVQLRYELVRAGGTAPALSDTVSLAAGAPWIVRGPGYVLIASPLVPDATDLPVRASFVPWIADALAQDLGSEGRVIAAAPLARVARPANASELESPAGTRAPIDGDSLDVPGEPGVYWFIRSGARAGALVVDAEPAESDLARLDSAALAARLHARAVSVVSDSSTFAAAAFGGAPRRAIGGWLLGIAVALLLVEGAITAADRRPVQS